MVPLAHCTVALQIQLSAMAVVGRDASQFEIRRVISFRKTVRSELGLIGVRCGIRSKPARTRVQGRREISCPWRHIVQARARHRCIPRIPGGWENMSAANQEIADGNVWTSDLRVERWRTAAGPYRFPGGVGI